MYKESVTKVLKKLNNIFSSIKAEVLMLFLKLSAILLYLPCICLDYDYSIYIYTQEILSHTTQIRLLFQ